MSHLQAQLAAVASARRELERIPPAERTPAGWWYEAFESLDGLAGAMRQIESRERGGDELRTLDELLR